MAEKSIADHLNELLEMVKAKETQRDTIQAEIDAFHVAIRKITGKPAKANKPARATRSKGKARGKRAKGDSGSLAEYLDKVMTSEPIGIKDLVPKLKAAGWKTGAKNPGVIVGQALATGVKDGKYAKQGRGEYRKA